MIDRGIRECCNEIDRYYDMAINVGGPIKRDKICTSAPTARSSTPWRSRSFCFDSTFDTKLWNPVVKGSSQVNQKNTLIGYYQWGQKLQPTRLPFGTYFYDSAGENNKRATPAP
ncbi:MAG: hypothetical protein OEW19_04575 [Acidobacteriota bacterium]|nr:hypothetical protein [Acidobacteriota bacterium]